MSDPSLTRLRDREIADTKRSYLIFGFVAAAAAVVIASLVTAI